MTQETADRLNLLDWPAAFPDWLDGETTRPDGDAAKLTSGFPRLNGHHRGWVEAISAGLKHPAYLLRSSRGGAAGYDQTTGVLPLMLVKGPLFGRFLVSLPYLNTGGAWAIDAAAAATLVDGACDLADRLDVRYLELRHERPVENRRLNHCRTDKVHMRLSLPESDEELERLWKSKLRSQIKKAGEYGSTVHWGRLELLDDFYRVFAENMRDLGTPVFSKRLFAAILDRFDGAAELCVLRQADKPVAAALLTHLGGVTEVPSASSLRQYNRTNVNMLMYRRLLSRAIERQSHTFDFGRSSEGSGTYKFKAQWGAEPHPAVWQYYVRQGNVDAMRPDSQGNQRLIRVWQRLPVWLTRLVGPTIVRGIP